MTNEVQAAELAADDGLPSSIVKRPDGVYFKGDATASACQAGINHFFLAGAYFAGIDYAVFIRMLYNAGPELPQAMQGQPLIRFADRVEPFQAVRRDLYKSVRIVNGEAEYYFEPVFFIVPDMPPQPARLQFDEFVADMWAKGIRFGIDAPAVQATIASGRVVRLIAARKLAATPGRDAAIVEVSQSIHRSNAPREMANGRFDLHTFQNRFPQVQPHVKLLKKVPRAPGLRGYELSGIPLEPAEPRDIDLASVAGEGTVLVQEDGVEYIESVVEGFLSIDAAKKISIGPKIISREGVSVRTTGNLQLTGEYEEFGEVQEQRVVDGGNITIHGDVFGNIISRGGDIALQRNLVGGSAVNAGGNIHIKGVASASVIQTRLGEVVLARAENCVISGTRVVIGEASNCEIMADEVLIKNAEGCAIAARRIDMDSAGPRRQTEMLLFPLVPDTSKYDIGIAEHSERAARFGAQAQRIKAEIDAITSEPELRKYLMLATSVRKQEVMLTPEQLALFQKMAAAVGPSLRSVGKLSLAAKEAQGQQAVAQEQAALVARQKEKVIGHGRCVVRMVAGDLLVREMKFNPDLGAPYDRTPKDIKTRLRGSTSSAAAIFSGAFGEVDWATGAPVLQAP